MAKILARALTPLATVFGIKGSQVSTEDLDLSGVQLVADVPQLAGVGRAPGGFAGRTVVMVDLSNPIASTTAKVTVDPFTASTQQRNAWGVIAEDFDLWVLGCSVEAVQIPTAFDVAAIHALMPALYVGLANATPQAPRIPLYSATALTDSAESSAGVPRWGLSLDVGARFPIFLPRGTTLEVSVLNTGTINLQTRSHIRLAVLPRGLVPVTQ